MIAGLQSKWNRIGIDADRGFPFAVALKDTIQELFDIQAATNGYVDGTDEVLVEKM